MVEVREVLRRHEAGQSLRQIARETGIDRKTLRRYLAAAHASSSPTSAPVAPSQESAPPGAEQQLALIARTVQKRSPPPPSAQWKLLLAQRLRLERWLRAERPLRLVRVHELLLRDGIEVGYTTLRRFAHEELARREREVTVRLDDPPPGQEAQVDFGHVSWLVDAQGRRRKLWALIVTLSFSRYGFVWPTFVQTLESVCEGLDAAWTFFGGVPLRVLPDNLTPVVLRADPQEPTVQRSFLEYAQARSLYVDPARVRRPKDKARVENQVPYVRERCFDGETLLDLEHARRHASRWCAEVAGCRVHGTTRRVPREVYESEERPHMQPAPAERFDVPVWSQAKVHPDHHVQVAHALYSLPTAYVGRTVDVRLDRASVRLYLNAELLKVHPRMPPGQRSTDPTHYPTGRAEYARRDVDSLVRRARAHGEQVAHFVERLLAGPLPWTKMRQAYALLRLCERYGAARGDAACARALSFDVLEVPRVERMLQKAQQAEEEGVAQGTVIPLPKGRFARDAESFRTQPSLPLEGAQEGER